ncbi:2-keto-4-pentenoate hydratase [Polymorphobacter sp.]|uniref:2-keto-4-pentenoate hydratase n=1 Tax=Polymorphobacter sp. TaxID=1909290 RepID=UPI003F6FB8EF
MNFDVMAAAGALDRAACEARAVPQFGEALDLDTAYRVQKALMARRYARGERRVGMKLGFTSKAKMIQMGVDDLIWGTLTDAMLVADGGTLEMARFIHPRVEPEIVFRLGRRLGGLVTVDEARAAIEAVAPAMEIIDSRYAAFKFSLADVVADNSSSAALVIGAWRTDFGDLNHMPMRLLFDGAVVQAGSSEAILGDPLEALVAAARLAGANGGALEPGDIVLAGAATAAEALRPGVAVRVEADGLGAAGFSVG